jgi:uncharacterized protein YegP (UPF0339 family)
MAHFEIFPDSAGEYRYRLVADNHEIVCISEGYRDIYDAERGAVDLVRTVLDARKIVMDNDDGFSINVSLADK